jgi:phosphoglycolate phosphatase
MLLCNPSAVIWDWDGTLLNTVPLIYRAVNKTHAHYGQPPEDPKEVRKFTAMTREQTFRIRFPHADQQEALQLYKQFIEEEHGPSFADKQSRANMLMPGVEALLELFHANGVKQFIVSNKDSTLLRREIVYLNWGKYFTGICGAQDTLHHKPDGRAALDLLVTHSIPANESVWFIGDSFADVGCAKNAGLTAILVSEYDYTDNIQPDFTFPDMIQFQKSIRIES